jgi:hypothetical protein
VSKLVAGRPKDYAFAAALIDAGLIDRGLLAERTETINAAPAIRRRVQNWIFSWRR